MKTSFTSALLLASLFTTGAALAGPSGHNGNATPATAGQSDRVIEVTATEMAFSPSRVEIKEGETVRFVVTNEGRIPHEFSIATPVMHTQHRKEMMQSGGHGDGHGESGGGVASEVITMRPGETKSLTWTFQHTGEVALQYACNIPGHYEAGMKGTLDVHETMAVGSQR